jgi:hypothetical protein
MGSAQDDVVPHIIIRSPRLRSGKIVFGDAKDFCNTILPLIDMAAPSSITLARPMAPLNYYESVFALHASADLLKLHSASYGFAINCQI